MVAVSQISARVVGEGGSTPYFIYFISYRGGVGKGGEDPTFFDNSSTGANSEWA